MANNTDSGSNGTPAEPTQGRDPWAQALLTILQTQQTMMENAQKSRQQIEALTQHFHQCMQSMMDFQETRQTAWMSHLSALHQAYDYQMSEMRQQLEDCQRQMLRASPVPTERVTVSIPRAEEMVAEESHRLRDYVMDPTHQESSILQGAPPVVVKDTAKSHGQQRPATWCSTCRVTIHSTRVCRMR